MEFLDVPLFDDDFWKLLVRFAFNFAFVTILVRGIYYPAARRKDYLFTYFLISVLVFFICFTLKKFELGLGMALGLFALFGILRYRTDPIPIKEMTYLFVVIGLAVINALSNTKTSYAELLFTNGCIALVAYRLEKSPLLRPEQRQVLCYENIELIHAGRRDELLADVRQRTGLPIFRCEVGRIDYLRDTAILHAFYYDDGVSPPGAAREIPGPETPNSEG